MEKVVEINLAGQDVRFEIEREGDVHYARPTIVSQRFQLPPVFFGVAKTPGRSLENCKELVGAYVERLNASLRA